jgi:hypothetical protein
MPSNRRLSRMVASLLLVVPTLFALAPSTQAGPISEMITRRRIQRQVQPSVSNKSFSPSTFDRFKTTSLKDRFKKRFSPKPGSSVISDPFNHGMTDVIKTSR